jgi:hypothetical protein
MGNVKGATFGTRILVVWLVETMQQLGHEIWLVVEGKESLGQEGHMGQEVLCVVAIGTWLVSLSRLWMGLLLICWLTSKGCLSIGV